MSPLEGTTGGAHEGAAGDPFTQTQILVQKAQGGDASAANELFAAFRAPLERYLHAQLPWVVRSIQDTQDAVQEVLLRMHRSLAQYQYKGAGSFWGYLRTIARHYVAETVRERKRWGGAQGAPEQAATPDLPAKQPSAHDTAVSRERFAKYERALDRVSPRTRMAFLMKFELKMEYEAIARDCGFKSADAARMAVTRAVRQMAKEMGEEGEKKESQEL